MAGLSLGNILSAVKLASLLALVAALIWYRHSAQTWENAFERLKAEYVAASQMAAYRHIAATQAAEARYSAKAAQQDVTHAKALESAHRASDSFIARRLRTGNQCAPGGTTATAESAGAQPVDGPDPAAELVAVSASDVSICTENSIRLQSAQQWATSLGE